MTTNHHGVAAFDFATVSGCDQLVVSPIHSFDGALYLLVTEVPHLVRASVAAPLSNSDYSSISVVILMTQSAPNLCVRRNFPETPS